MPDSSIIEIIEQFKSRDSARRMTAVDRAARDGSPAAVALLVKALQDQSWSLREHAVTAAAGAGRAAVPSLVRLLNCGVWYAREAAARVLERTGDASCLAPLSRQAGDANASAAESSRRALAAVLSRIEPEKALAALASCPRCELGGCLPAIRQIDPPLAERLERAAAEFSTPAADAADRLQGLRRAIRAALKRDSSEDDEES